MGVLRGVQIVARAVGDQQEQCLKHLWANSSIRDAISSLPKCNATKGDGPDLQNTIRETLERGSVVLEGMRHLVKSPQQSPFSSGSPIPSSLVPDPNNLDISSLTLRELENFLSQQNKTRVQLKNPSSTKPIPPVNLEPAVVVDEDSAFREDEESVKKLVRFVATHKSKSATPVLDEEPTPESNSDPTDRLELSTVARQRKVPSSRIGRMVSFGSLFAGVGLGTVGELAKGHLGLGGTTNIREAVLNPNNTERIVDTLCKVRGAALKIGQILSIQDSNIVSPQLAKAFERVRQAADYMPDWQVEKTLRNELGDEWRTRLKEFEMKPFAAASIGQVHRGELHDGRMVAVKIQYPGVGKSIESDIDNLVGILKLWNVFPPGMFIDNIVRVAKRELAWEVDYEREAEYTEKFQEMMAPHKGYKVPDVIRELTTSSILTTEFVPGVPLDKCFALDYHHRKIVGQRVMDLCIRELFEMRCMQTDPNWSNFLYDPESERLMLIDFGSTRFYTKEFIDNYVKVTMAAARKDRAEVLRVSEEMGFLTGFETKSMKEAHIDAVMILGEVFSCEGEFDFGKQDNTSRIVELVPTMVSHRLCPPPDEIYSIHRKLSGAFLLCSRLKIKLNCRDLFNQITSEYKFG